MASYKAGGWDRNRLLGSDQLEVWCSTPLTQKPSYSDNGNNVNLALEPQTSFQLCAPHCSQLPHQANKCTTLLQLKSPQYATPAIGQICKHVGSEIVGTVKNGKVSFIDLPRTLTWKW